MNRVVIVGTLLGAAALLVLVARPRATLAAAKATTLDLRVGQEWRFLARPEDPDPRLVIDKLEALPKIGDVVHVSVRGVHIRNPRASGGYSDTIAHMPLSRLAVESSVTELVHDSVPLPAYEAGYQEWRAAQGGVFTVSVREGLEFMERALN